MIYLQKNSETWPNFDRNQANIVKKILLSNKVNYWTGNQGKDFELEFKKYIGVKYAVAIANASLGLEYALKAVGISYGDEVIVTPKSFITSVSSIISLKATPVFADIDLNSHNISVDQILKKISNKTKAIMCVHLAGFPCDMRKIIKIAKNYNLKIIEDCSQALGGKIDNQHLGSFGNISVWSFCNDKIISTGGEGGMICTNNKRIWKQIWSLKDTGKNYDKVYKKKHNFGFKWLNDNFGTNLRMTEIQAALGRYQLNKLDGYLKRRKNNSIKIINECKKYRSLTIQEIPQNYEHAFYRCYILVNDKYLINKFNRDKIIQSLNKSGVLCNVGSCSEIYLEKAFHGKKYKPKKRLRNAMYTSKNTIAFLVHPTLSSQYINYSVGVIRKLMNKITI